MFKLIRYSMWDENINFSLDQDIFEEMKKHAIYMLPVAILPNLSMPDTLREDWKRIILQGILHNTQCRYMQDALPITVPYVILKGTSAAQYYPHPEYRTLGDIDLITRREDYEVACNSLLQNGFKEEYSSEDETYERHRGFSKNGIMIEVHRFFASLNDPICAKYLDDLIIANINPSHVLPDLVDGLVLLEHLSQHLEVGLGLRQIIDWMMFVDKCLPDEKWLEYQIHVRKIGLEQLAVVSTRMCEVYLGLPRRSWCADADPALCDQLMDYVLSCGNFGNKRTEDSDIGENVFSIMRSPRAFIKLLQERGLVNWPAAKKHRGLRPFAWVYQAFRYAFRGLNRNKAFSKLKEEYGAAQQRIAMFDALGVRTRARGRTVYLNGRYVKR